MFRFPPPRFFTRTNRRFMGMGLRYSVLLLVVENHGGKLRLVKSDLRRLDCF